ncbi:MAG TPA: serine hydrolase domain-containing protein [Acidobacteriota bacterium]|nr:serine hydrolase domain-containing protein [Acidobacteriota bacterium]
MRILSLPFLALSLLLGSLAAQPNAPSTASAKEVAAFSPPASAGLDDPVALEAFVDGLMASQMKARKWVGSTVSVVRGGRLIFSKGYGHADLEQDTPVDPATTLFRIGSVSKLFTWTAVMQLVEQGRLDLDADVNQYLETFQIPETYPEPVTLKHLMTHTPGFEDVVIGLFAKEEDTRPLAEVLSSDIPKRVRPPGVQAAYSNWGTALAGLIVSNVSGQSYESYVEDNILQPLGMTYCTARQPVPQEISQYMSKGYTFEGGEFVAKPFEHVPMSPAGAFSASAESMARFMLAHLDPSQEGSPGILQPQTVLRMREELFRPHPRSNAMLYGFIEGRPADPHIFGHGGDTIYFHTMLVLVPEADTGIFLSFNSAQGGQARGDVYDALLERYFPRPESPQPEPAQDVRSLDRFAGSYVANRASETTLAKLAQLIATVEVEVDPDGYLLMRSPQDGEINRYAPLERLVFQHTEKSDKLIFEQDANGEVRELHLSNLPIMAFHKVGGLRSPTLHMAIMGISLVWMLSAVVLWPFAPLLRRKSESTMAARDPRPPLWPSLLGWAVSLLFIIFAVGFAIVLSDPISIVFGVPASLQTLLWIPLAAGFLSILLLAGLWVAWRHSYWGVIRRLHFTLLTVLSFALLWVLNYWNLLGFNY